jgi:hypothetical protein
MPYRCIDMPSMYEYKRGGAHHEGGSVDYALVGQALYGRDMYQARMLRELTSNNCLSTASLNTALDNALK